MKEEDLKVGKVVWYVPDNYAIAIRCKVTYIDDYFRKKYQKQDGILFYDVDEPIGHSVYGTELTTKRKAQRYLESMRDDNKYKFESVSLDYYRRNRLKFIVKTWPKEEKRPIKELLKAYPQKIQGKDWFTLSDLQVNCEK